MRRYRFARRGDQGLEILDEIAATWIDPPDAQQHQKPGDPIAVRGSLGHQHRAFSVLSFGIFSRRAWNAHHPAGACLAAFQRQ